MTLWILWYSIGEKSLQGVENYKYNKFREHVRAMVCLHYRREHVIIWISLGLFHGIIKCIII
ncbi:MAG TPA: hypothetical protein DDW53_12830 [Lachnoclostridium sp.]|nr:hypothetical protein [Lachnoclostridium sp.]